MDKKVFEDKIKPILTFIGLIGAVVTSVAYVILVIVLIKGFQYQQTIQTVIFASANAAVGMIIASFLKYQGISFAKELPENQEVIADYYSNRTKDKKNRSIQYFWVTSTIKDVIFKGLSVAASTLGLIYIVIIGSNDWSLLLLALVNLLLFICFGLLALNQAYDYYNNVYINYMKDRLAESTQEAQGECGYVVITDDDEPNKPVSCDLEIMKKISEPFIKGDKQNDQSWTV